MARSFSRGSVGRRTQPTSISAKPASLRAFRNDKARESNKNQMVKDSDGKVYSNYNAYKDAVRLEQVYKDVVTPSPRAFRNDAAREANMNGGTPVNNTDRFSSNTRSTASSSFKYYKDAQLEAKRIVEEEDKENFTRDLTQKALESNNPLLMRTAAEAEISAYAETGEYSDLYTQATEDVAKALSGEYLIGVSESEWMEWYENNTHKESNASETGHHSYVRVLNEDAAPPPIGYNEAGETIDIEASWNYYLQVSKAFENETAKQEKEAKMWADPNNESINYYNSFADFVTGALNAVTDGKDSTTVSDVWGGYCEHLYNHYWQPLKNRNIAAFGLNTLFSLGENFDLLPRGVKAVVGSQRMVYGHDTHWTNEKGTMFEDQEYWVYSGGEETQKKLMDLGAWYVLKPNGSTYNQRAAAIQNIKDAGLWDEYLKLKEEYDSDYDLGSLKNTWDAVKKAYTTHENYYYDTGNILSDITLELVNDPTLLANIGGGVGKGIAREAGQTVLAKSLNGIGKGVDVLEDTTAFNINSLSKQLTDDLLSKGSDEIAKISDDITSSLKTNGVFTDAYQATKFRDNLIRNTQEMVDSKAFGVVKSLLVADKVANFADTTMLKGSFIAPYAAYKIGKPVVNKVKPLVREGTAKFKVFWAQLDGRIGKYVDQETDTVKIINAEDYLRQLEKEPLVAQNPTVKAQCISKIRRGVEDTCTGIDRIITQKWDSIADMDAAISKYITEVTEGKYVDFAGYVQHLDGLVKKFDTLADTASIAKKQFDNYTEHKKLLNEGFKHPYKTPVVSNSNTKVPIVKADKAIDKSERLRGNLKKDWKALARKYGKDLPDGSPYKLFLDSTRVKAPTLKEARAQLVEMLSELTLANKIDTEAYKDFVKLYNDLTQTKLSVDIHKDLQFNAFHKDKFAVFEEAISDPFFKKVIDKFINPSSATAKFMRQYLEGTVEINEIWVRNSVDELLEQIQSLNAMQAFIRKVELETGPLTDDIKYSLLDSLFNRDFIDPNRLTDMQGKEMDELITRVSTSLSALDGVESFALDSFRKIAIDFDNPIWGRFSDEIKDPSMQLRVRKILAGGHENPVDDVNVQILQVLLRDPEAITKYNDLNKYQDVVFYDIETRGLNLDNNDITCIAMKKWDNLSEEATLDDIITFLEKDGVYYQTYLPAEEIEKITPYKILELNYGKRADVSKDRDSMMELYLERFSAEANGKTVTRQEMLGQVMATLDTYTIKRKGNAPVLISHNNNGFDMNFVQRQMIKEKVYPAKMKNIDAFVAKEQNTYKMLRSQYPESSLSGAQEIYIRRIVASYAKDVAAFSSSMRVFSPGEFVQSIKNCLSDTKMEGDAWTNMVQELSELKVDEVQNALLEHLADSKVMFAFDPFHRTVDSFDDKTIVRIFGKDRLSDIRKMADEEFQKIWIKEVYGRDVTGTDSTYRLVKDAYAQDKVARFGYKAIKVNELSNYFNIIGKRISQGALMKMDSFSKACGRDITKRLQSNQVLLNHLDDFKAVINYVKDFAVKLEAYDDFAFIKYIEAPESIDEAYVVAQRLWDIFMSSTRYDEAIKCINENIPYKDISKDIQPMVVALTRFGDDFDITKVVSGDARAILANSGNKWHHLIYKDVFNEEAYYLSQITEDEYLAKALVEECRRDERALKNMSLMIAGNKNTKVKDAILAHLLKNSREAIEHYLSLSDAAKKIFKEECNTALSRMMDAQTAQIMKNISESEINLISHLLYHNQVLVTPTIGSDLHLMQLEQLQKVLSGEDASKYLYHTIDDQGYMWVGIKKEWEQRIEVKNDAAHVTDETEMSFHGEEGVYKAPEYDRIVMSEKALSDSTLAKYFIDTEANVFKLSKGASAGSLGISHTMSKQSKLYANAPQGFLDNTLSLEFTCNERLWHNANYDMSLLGGMSERWKVGGYNEIDYLIATRQTLVESAKKAQAERLFIQSIFAAEECLRIQDVFSKDISDADIAKSFKESDEMVCVRLTESDVTESGYYIQTLDVTTAAGVKAAKESDAIVIPYHMLSTLGDAINQSKAHTGFLKLYTKMLHLYKLGYLISPGTVVRNFIDSTMKALGDTGDPLGLASNYIHAANMLRSYKKATETINLSRGVDHNTLADIERMWDSYNFKMTFQEYKFIDEWLHFDESGGESAVLKTIKEYRQKNKGISPIVNKVNNGKDFIGDSIVKFELIPEETARQLYRKANISNQVKLSEDEFAAIFAKRVVPDESTRLEYESICHLLMNEQPTYKQDFGAFYQRVNDKLLSPTTTIEEIVRLGEFMTLEQQGFTRSQIFKRITDSHFNYNLKSMSARRLELIIPFYTFMHDNMIYWCKQVSENPIMYRYIEKVWSELSWDHTDYEIEEIMYNKSLQAALLNGNIPIGNTGFMFKVRPAFLDAFQITYNPLGRLYDGLFQPIQNITQAVTRGSDARLLFGEEVYWTDNTGFLEAVYDNRSDLESRKAIKEIGQTLPIVGPIIDRLLNQGPEALSRLPEEGHWLKKGLVLGLPSMFGVIKSYKDEDDPQYNTVLEWDELVAAMAANGKLWDANQRKFVTLSEFIPGGLNQHFDFDHEGDWEEYCKYRKLYLGEVWDNNLGKFVPLGEKTVGGLNDPDCTWPEVLYYKAKQGYIYNSEINEFVDINDWPLEEQKIIRYVLFGEEYEESTGRWLQVTDPMQGFGTVEEVVSVVEEDEENWLQRVGLIATAYADEPDAVRELVRNPGPYYEASLEEVQAFLNVMDKLGLGGYTNDKVKNYKATDITPWYKSGAYNNIRTIHTPRSIKNPAVYKQPYNYGSNAGVKMALSGDAAYDEFYNYRYIYSYKFRNPQRGVADFPQSKLGIQRYMRMRTDALTRRMRLRAEYDIENINSLRGVAPRNRLQNIKLHWWMR